LQTSPLPKKKTRVGDETLEHVVVGSGSPTIVLVNGSGGPIEGWHKVLAPLEALSTVFAYNRLVASLDVLILRPRNGSTARAFLYFLTGTEDFVAHTYAHTTGTTALHLAKEAVPSFQFAQPPVGLSNYSILWPVQSPTGLTPASESRRLSPPYVTPCCPSSFPAS